MTVFQAGINLPWGVYGCDFGANAWQPDGGLARSERRRALDRELGRLAASGIERVRWFLLCDGRAGLSEDDEGHPVGLDSRFFGDLDAALELAAAHRLSVFFVLMDFLWLGAREVVNGVSIHGRGRTLADERARMRLLDGVVATVLEHCRDAPAVAAWDVFNEPEWATRGLGARGRSRGVTLSFEAMRGLLGALVERVHRHAAQPATVGLASARGLPLVRGLGLDFYQVHWYDTVERRAPLRRPVAELGLDRPVLLGEFPTRGSALPPRTILELARAAGYSGAFAWSALADDHASDGRASESVVADWIRGETLA